MSEVLPSQTEDYIVEALLKNAICQDFTIEELSALAQISTIQEVKTQEIVFSECEESKYLYIVAEGQMVLLLRKNQEEQLETGDLFGEIGVINDSLRSASVRAQSDGKVIRICGHKLFLPEFIQADLSLKITRALARNIINLLLSREQTSTNSLIARGENEYVEFKASLRMNPRSGKKEKNIELGIIKTIAGFMNTKGGTLLIGVEDNGHILGLKGENFENADKLILHLIQLIKSRIGLIHSEFIHAEVVYLEEKPLLRVDCEAARVPAYVQDEGKEFFFIRTGPSTSKLKLSKVYPYIYQRFGQV
ncbi:MAG: RNA-binding domain-containing protein [Bacteroidota bacterium]